MEKLITITITAIATLTTILLTTAITTQITKAQQQTQQTQQTNNKNNNDEEILLIIECQNGKQKITYAKNKQIIQQTKANKIEGKECENQEQKKH